MNKIYKKLFGQNDTSEDKSGGDVREENENSIRDMGSVVTETASRSTTVSEVTV